jgi:hypothetical protein
MPVWYLTFDYERLIIVFMVIVRCSFRLSATNWTSLRYQRVCNRLQIFVHENWLELMFTVSSQKPAVECALWTLLCGKNNVLRLYA